MANIKITDLDAYTNPDSTDVLPIVDVDADTTKRVTIADLMENAGAGTAALPGIAFDGDPNTGIYRPAADQIALSTAGVQRLLIDDNGDVTIAGGLEVQGTTTFINTTNLQVEDKNIELGKVGTPSDTTADGGGITLLGTTNHTISWSNSGDSWDFSEHVNIASGKVYKIAGSGVLSATELGSGVTASSLTSVGTITTGVWNGTPLTSDYIGTAAITTAKVADDAIDADKLANTTVTAGSYTAADITVDAQGRITAASSSAGSIQDKIEEGNSSVEVTDTGNNGTIIFTNEGAESARIVSANRSLFGADTVPTIRLAGSNRTDSSHFFVKSGTNLGGALNVVHWSGNSSATWGTDFVLAKSFSGTVGTHVAPGSNALISRISLTASDGTRFVPAASIEARTNGTVGDLSMPGALLFNTTAASGSNPTERMRIDSSGNVTIDTTTFFVDAVNNRVGVGTTSPGRALEIGTSQPAIEFNNGTNAWSIGTGAFIDGSDSFCFFDEGVGERMRIDSSGRVGIGTSSPDTNLVVKGATGDAAIKILAHNTFSQSRIQFADSTAVDGVITYDHNSRKLHIGAGTSTATDGDIVIDSSGNVGIGTTSPAYELEVAGSAAFGANGVAGQVKARRPSDGLVGGYFGYATTGSNDLYISNASGSQNIIAQTNFGAFIFNSASATERARIDSSGRLLVGTSGSTAVASTAAALIQTRFSGSFTNFAAIRESAPPVIVFGRANGNAAQIVSSGDELGTIRFAGADGTDLQTQAATISAFVDGTPGANDMPGRLVFSTTADGASSPTERMRISSTGLHTITASNNSTAVQIRDASNYAGQLVTATDGTFEINARTATTFTRTGSNTESMRIDSSGRLQVGLSNFAGNAHFAIRGDTASSTNGGRMAFVNSGTITTGSRLGLIEFGNQNGNSGVTIGAYSDGAWGGNDYPGALYFFTTADGASSPTERLRIASTGAFGLSGANYGTSGQVLTSNGSGSSPSWQSATPAALSTASGSAPSYSARAWVNWQGTGTVSIRDDDNVSSITDNGTGVYTVNFTTAMPHANYAAVFTGNGTGLNNSGRMISAPADVAPTTGSIRCVCLNFAGGNTDLLYGMMTVVC